MIDHSLWLQRKEKIMNKFLWTLVLAFGINAFANASSPILSNFRIENSYPDRVYFDSSGDISGLTKQGFIISGKTISSLDVGGSYFKVSSAFTFWDNNTIRLENGNGIVSDFTLSYIKNNIFEPDASNYRYVTTSASGGGNGLSEGNAWTLTQAFDNAEQGQTIWIKAGNYGSITKTISKKGQMNSPIKFIGYKSVIGDIKSNYYDYGITFKTSEMPTLSGADATSTYGLTMSNSHYLIFRNIQMTNYVLGIRAGSPNSNLIFDRFNGKTFGTNASKNGAAISFTTSGGAYFTGNTNTRIINTTIINCSMTAIALYGEGNNLVDNTKVYSDRTGSYEKADYAISVNGHYNIVRKSYIENFNNTETNTSTHGITIRGSRMLSNTYNLIEQNTAVNFQEAYAIRNYGCAYNVIKDCVAKNNGAASSEDRGGVWFWGGVWNNIVERCDISDVDMAIGFKDNQGEDNTGDTSIGHDNIIRNCNISGSKYAIYLTGTDASANSLLKNTKVLNCNFYNNSYFVRESSYPVRIDNFEIINSNIVKINSGAYTANISDFSFDSNNFFNSWTNSIGSNSLNVNPNFENESSGNFRLKSNSPLIDKGKNLDIVKSDFDRSPRPTRFFPRYRSF